MSDGLKARITAFLGLLILGASHETLWTQTIETNAPRLPTRFSSHLKTDPRSEAAEALKENASSQIQNYGGSGKAQTLWLRGAKAADLGVSLEGIRLNSPSGGEFDFGNLSSFGLGPAELIRGTSSPYSTNPSGQVLLSLPRKEETKALVSLGSHESLGLGLQIPGLSLSLDQSQNNFEYDLHGESRERSHNFYQRMNLRAWKRSPRLQVWTQVLYNDQELPGSIDYPSPQAKSQLLQPTLAFQKIWKSQEVALWVSAQKQIYEDPSWRAHDENYWYTIGGRYLLDTNFNESAEWQFNLDWSLDKFWADRREQTSLSSPYRNTLGLGVLGLVDLTKIWTLSPSTRLEFISDLPSERFSFHPSIGNRLKIHENWDILANLHFVSRSPNFNEMYFENPGPIPALANPHLKRQKSFQGDFGFESHAQILKSSSFVLQTCFFFDRTEDLLQDDPRDLAYQIQNIGTALTYGWETELHFEVFRNYGLDLSYTLQRSKIEDVERIYQPSQHLFLQAALFKDSWMNLAIPFYYRSQVHAPLDQKISAQADLGFILKMNWGRSEVQWTLKNLLGWNREEIKGYPLGNQPSMTISWIYLFSDLR